jgi:GNAT superfamily N-acetyltransferase
MENQGLAIRRAGASDAPALARLFGTVYKDGSHPFLGADAIKAFLADSSNVQIVAENGGQLIASMAMAYNPWNDSYELGRALTLAEYRCHGLAASLIQNVVNWAADEGYGELVFGFPRVRRIVDLCAALSPRMVAVGHDAGRNVANGARETHAIVCGILRPERFVHVVPASSELLQWPFLIKRIYAPLGLHGSIGQYPEDCFVGNRCRDANEFDGWIFEYQTESRALEIIGGQLRLKAAAVRRSLDRLLARLGDVAHISVTVPADKVTLIRALIEYRFELAAYLPAWYKVGRFRYDCVQLAKRLYAEVPREQDLGALLTDLGSEFNSIQFLGHPYTRQAVAS